MIAGFCDRVGLMRSSSERERVRHSMEAAQKKDAAKSTFAEYDYSNFYYGAGDDPLNLLGPFMEWYREALPNGYYLYSEPLSSAPSTKVRVRNRKTGQVVDLINMASYNYLGISYREEVKEAAIEATRRFGLGASGSPILSGTFEIHKELESEVAAFKDKEAAILFPTGYSANVGFISAIMRAGDTILLDQYSHASIVDGAILAKSRTVFFRHNNPMDLERKLNGLKGKKLVVVEGVYSMDGDVCVLPEIVEVAKRHGARILIDEAHSTFLFGPNGRGVAEHFGLDKEVDFHLGTFSKSLGGQGGFVCGSRDLVDYVNAFARSRFFSCNLAPMIAAGLLAGLRIVERQPKSAFYPYLVGTTTKAARDHAIERWHLPHWMEDVDVRFDRQGKAVTARVEVDGSPVADLTITDHSWNPVSHLYQAFMKDDRGAYLASITMEGQQSEHEEETGRIQLHEHPFNKDLVISEIYDQPFREMWMREGRQTFEPLIQLQTV